MKKNFVPYKNYKEYPEEEMRQRVRDFYGDLKRRRTVREFADRAVPREVIEDCIRAAGTAPNGANMQPWHFVAVSDPGVKSKIREAAEEEEREFYEHRANEEWLEALEPFGTDHHKPFLEEAPYLIAIFEKRYDLDEQGHKTQHYYVKESVGIATGMLITAIHRAGLVSLTHTPNPMGFLNEILDRPKNERPFLLLVVGYPSEGVEVPDITKKPLDEIATFV
ncbi:nitroreductase family protein [Aliifodinibius sp. S!AR15-10]|uniref:nitroreductase family protein n=1 Tax=Aliifodinibius sp. S!AR15-10 TaxID=2950437 RepID=UPI002864B124|nr:nitroreductase family protein [Aliifodinibius sp. S!AR15-10]MDR8393151.1 nitroreductase family protein [Aliifodinibius sp. S!AR15-10]